MEIITATHWHWTLESTLLPVARCDGIKFVQSSRRKIDFPIARMTGNWTFPELARQQIKLLVLSALKVPFLSQYLIVPVLNWMERENRTNVLRPAAAVIFLLFAQMSWRAKERKCERVADGGVTGKMAQFLYVYHAVDQIRWVGRVAFWKI